MFNHGRLNASGIESTVCRPCIISTKYASVCLIHFSSSQSDWCWWSNMRKRLIQLLKLFNKYLIYLQQVMHKRLFLIAYSLPVLLLLQSVHLGTSLVFSAFHSIFCLLLAKLLYFRLLFCKNRVVTNILNIT